jgi:uncharacterized membrane protein
MNVEIVGLGLSIVVAFFAGAAWLVNRMDRLHEQTQRDRHALAERTHMMLHEEIDEVRDDMKAIEVRLTAQIRNNGHRNS